MGELHKPINSKTLTCSFALQIDCWSDIKCQVGPIPNFPQHHHVARLHCVWACMEVCLCSLEPVIVANVARLIPRLSLLSGREPGNEPTCVVMMAPKPLAAAAINCMVDQCSRLWVSDTIPLWTKLSILHDSRDRLVLHGQLYVTNYKYEGYTLKPYLPENKIVVVLKVLILECAWMACL